MCRSTISGSSGTIWPAATYRSRPADPLLHVYRPAAGAGWLARRGGSELAIAARVAKLPIIAVLRSRTMSEKRGFMKALVEAGGDHILGFTMIGRGQGSHGAGSERKVYGACVTPRCTTRLSRARQRPSDSSRSCSRRALKRENGEHSRFVMAGGPSRGRAAPFRI